VPLDLLSLRDRLALGLGALGFRCGLVFGVLTILRSAVRTHDRKLSVEAPMGQRQKKDLAVARGLDGVSHYSRFKRRLVQTGNSQIEFEAADFAPHFGRTPL
jgi:hypothetical protein